MTEGERFVRGLVAALPEAFEGRDVAEEYDYSLESSPGDDPWAMTIALADAVQWIEDQALDVDRRAQTCTVRSRGADPLRRFFSYIEAVVSDLATQRDGGWIQVELFEGIPWTEDVIGYLGAQTKLLLDDAQRTMGAGNGWIGRWSDEAPHTHAPSAKR